MDTLPLTQLISSVPRSFSMRWHLTSGSFKRVLGLPLQIKRVSMRIGHSRFNPSSKEFNFQDFQGFAKPLRLLPAAEANIYSESSLEEMFTSFGMDRSCSFYVVQLRTNDEFDSCLSDSNAAILLCLIDVNGDSILQRLSVTLLEDPVQLKERVVSKQRCFQRGSVDKFTFMGPKLGKIEALWIGLESGSWRLGGVRLTMVSARQCSLGFIEEEIKESQYSGLHYDFEASDILLGEGEGVSMAELRPLLITELPMVDLVTMLNTDRSRSSLSNNKISAEGSMKEYLDLKFSLLLYDAILIIAGTTLTFSTSEKAAYAFLIGGMVGFFYLLLLQNSVDGLSAPALPTVNGRRENLVQVFSGFKGPLSRLGLAIAFAVVIVKYGLGDDSVALAPRELLLAVAGFFTCKIAVVMAAFKPMSTDPKENK